MSPNGMIIIVFWAADIAFLLNNTFNIFKKTKKILTNDNKSDILINENCIYCSWERKRCIHIGQL